MNDRRRMPALRLSALAVTALIAGAAGADVVVTGGGATETFTSVADAMAWVSDPARSMNHYDVQASGLRNQFAGFDVASNATLRWGNSPGVIELLGTRQMPYRFSGAVSFDIAGADNSGAFDGTGSVDYDTMLVLGGPGVIFDGVLQVNLLGGYVPTLGQTFELVAATGAIQWSGSIQGPVLPDGMTWQVSILAGSLEGQSIFVMTAVPAPSALALLGSVGLLARRRRRD